MNWLEKEVPSLELCKKLEELGYPQKGEGYWWVSIHARSGIVLKHTVVRESDIFTVSAINLSRSNKYRDEKKFVAPTCRELADWLPNIIAYKIDNGYREVSLKIERHMDDEWMIYYYDRGRFFTLGRQVFKGKRCVNIIAKMLIWLKETLYIDFKKEAK